MAHLVSMILDPSQKSFLLEILYHPPPGLEPVQACVRSSLLRHDPVFPDDTDDRKLVATPGFKVVGIVSGRHLHGSRSKLTIHERVRDQRDLSLHQGKDHSLPDQVLVAPVFRVDSHRCVPQHGFRACRRHLQEPVSRGQRVADMPELSGDGLMDHFEIRDGGGTTGTPVDQILTPVDQPLLIEPDEHLADRL